MVSKHSNIPKSRTLKLQKGHTSVDLQSPGFEELEVMKIQREKCPKSRQPSISTLD
jgi:hypothetical protein